MQKILYFFNNKGFLIINIIIFCILAYMFSLYNMCIPLLDHDCQHIYNYTYLEALSFKFTRVPPFLLGRLYSYTLPVLFDMHPADFKADYIVCIIMSSVYIMYCILLSRIFYLFCSKKTNYFKKPESIILLPVTFVFISVYLLDIVSQKQPVFLGIKDTVVFFEYLFGYILFFPFFTKLFDIIINKADLTKKEVFIYSFTGILMGLWSEFVNFPSLFSLLLILSGLLCFSRKDLKNKFFWILTGSFLTGAFIFYICSGNFNSSHFGTLSNFNVIHQFFSDKPWQQNFIHDFCITFFKDYVILWILLLAVTILLIFQMIFSPKEQKIIILKTIFLAYSLIFGYLLCTSLTIVADSTMRLGSFVFQLYYYPYIFYLIFIFSLILLIGAFYFHLNNIFKTILFIISGIILVKIFMIFLPFYNEELKNTKNLKFQQYKMEKKIILYSLFGENILLSSDDTFIDITSIYSKAKTYNLDFRYIEKIYRINYIGFLQADKDYSDKEMQKKENAFGKIKDKYNLFHVIKFSPLIKYRAKKLSLEEIDRLEQENGKNDIFTKARAYIYLSKENYNKALSLYKEYIKNNPDDLNAKVTVANIYKTLKQYNIAEKYYNEMIRKYNDNVYIKINMTDVYFLLKKYSDAAKMNREVISEMEKNVMVYDDILPVLYYEQAILYKKMKNKEKSREWYNKITNAANAYWLYIMFPSFNFDFEDFYNNDNNESFITSDILQQL